MLWHRLSIIGIATILQSGTAIGATEGGSAYKEMGAVHFAISCSAEAQAQFDHAVALLHSFFYPETVKQFTQVTETDPTCAMGYWGIAISQRPNPLAFAPSPEQQKLGWEAVTKGQALPAKTAREADWLATMATLYRDYDKTGYHDRVLLYTKAMQQLHQKYPDDSEAAILYALSLDESEDLTDKTYANQRQAIAILEKEFAAQPLHPGVAHYLIHSYDYPALAADGLPAARKYAALAPASPHATHMPSHIFSMLGDWTDLIQSDERALAAWEDYAAKNFGGATLASNLHSMDFLEYAYLQTGQDAKAKAILDKRNAITKWGNRNIPGTMGYAAVPVRYAVERGAWQEAAALAPMQTDSPAADAMVHFARAYGAARSGHPEAASPDIAKLEQLGNQLTEKKDAYWAGQVQIQFGAAKAWVAHAEGRNDEALKFMRLAADLEDKSEKHIAMENRLIPMRELLGDMLQENGDAAGALAAYEASLLKAPGRFRSYWGAAQAAEKLGDMAKAKNYYGKLVAMSVNSARPELAQARVKLAAN
jgi:hypothetical protein